MYCASRKLLQSYLSYDFFLAALLGFFEVFEGSKAVLRQHLAKASNELPQTRHVLRDLHCTGN